MTIGEIIKKYREENKISQRQFAARCGISNGYISMIENGVNPSTGEAPKPSLSALKGIARGMNTTLQNLFTLADDLEVSIESDLDPAKYGLRPLTRKRLPLLGEIACGEPRFADENREYYVEVGTDIAADFCLRAKGDSMTGARINDGDIVFIRSSPSVDNGQIAAVIIGDEATLKRVFYYQNKKLIILRAENPRYQDIIFEDADLENVRILGLAVAFQSDVI